MDMGTFVPGWNNRICYLVLEYRISRTPHSSKAQSSSNYISDDEIQAIKIIRELSRMYDEVDKRKTRKK